MPAYYNENDPYAAAWLRQLIAEGLITDGEVDERSIEEVEPADLWGFTRCHFFAGIAGWDLALALAGWPEGLVVWTGSCPCQPFSVAGKGLGEEDERHLWPVWYELIKECRPTVCVGEQSASPAGRRWLAAVRADLEDAGYAVGAADLCSAGLGAPNIRQRLWFVADSASVGWEQGHALGRRGIPRADATDGRHGPAHRGKGGLAESDGERLPQRSQRDGTSQPGVEAGEPGDDAGGCGDVRRVGYPGGPGLARWPGERGDDGEKRPAAERAGGQSGWWDEVEWIPCADGKLRPTQPGHEPLVAGIPEDVVCGGDTRIPVDATAEARVMRLRGYGNAINVRVATEFLAAYLDVRR